MSAEPSPGKPTVTWFTATCLVVANMIGTGVFTSLGFQVEKLPSGFAIGALWFIGGICALCGALCYAELAAALPRSGGEYHFVRETIHPIAGFLAGWLSATVGFAAPIALAAMALGRYGAEVLQVQDSFISAGIPGTNWQTPFFSPEMICAMAAVTLVSFIHYRGARVGSWFQNAATLIKLCLIAVLLVAGLLMTGGQVVRFVPAPGDANLIASPDFATSLVYVMYAYSGWNAATYIVGEIRDPERNVPRALIVGTTLVTILYIALNSVFLRSTPIDELRGKVEVGLIAGQHIFGETGGRVVGGFICLGLIASCSAMTWVGSRVSATMGEDIAALRPLAWRDQRGVPALALLVQLAIVAVLIATATFEKILLYIQFGLTLFSMLTVVGLLLHRWRLPTAVRPFRVPLYPLPPLIFLAISGWMLAYMLISESTRMPSLIGLGTILVGLALYFVSPKNPSADPSSRT